MADESKNYIFQRFHSVELIKIDIKGKPKEIEKLGIKSGVAAIVTDADNKIALVKQYRPCVDKVLYEIPAGLLDKEGKIPHVILLEELEEECEINRGSIEYFSASPIFNYYNICGSSDVETSIYRVRLKSVEQSKSVKDADVESVEWVTFEELANLMITGQLKDSKTLIAYMKLSEEYSVQRLK